MAHKRLVDWKERCKNNNYINKTAQQKKLGKV